MRAMRLGLARTTAGAAGALLLWAISGVAQATPDRLIETVSAVEERLNARVGLYVYDEETGRRWTYNADDRFPMASTFKSLACAALLARVDAGDERLDRVVTFGKSELVPYSPVTEERVGPDGMSLGEVCHATMTMSDNTAANLVMGAIGGPAGLTAFIRSTGDRATRLDRWETDLNEATPNDPRDTTTPKAMARTLRRLVFEEVLSLDSRAQLKDWLKGNKVGDALFRAGVPEDWTVGDRTGAGGHGTRAIAAILWPPGRQPVVATVYITETEASFEARNAAIADIGAAVAAAVVGPARAD